MLLLRSRWVKCNFTNEVESDTTDDDACDCHDSWDHLNGTYYECDVSLDGYATWDASWCTVLDGTESGWYQGSLVSI